MNPSPTPEAPTSALTFQSPPFADTADEASYFPADQHARALDFLGHALWSSSKVGVVIAESGCGKTLLIRRLMDRLDDRYIAAAVHQEKLGARDFLRQVLAQYGIELDDADKTDLRRLLERFIHHHAGLGRTCVLIVENAQSMHPLVLEELRCLAAIEVDGKRALKLLLLGQSSLNHVLDSQRLAELIGPKAPRYVLGAFSEDQTAAYIAHRLRAAGASDPDGILPATLTRQVHVRSRGIPGQINRICTRAIELAIEEGADHVSAELLDGAFADLGLPIAAVVSAPPSTAHTGSMPGIAKVVLAMQGAEDREILLEGDRIVIGRSELADIQIDSTFVSRYHALILRENNHDLLLDLGSTNGVLVGTRRVVRRVLQHRDLIQMGPARLTYINPDSKALPDVDPSETVCLSRPGFPSVSDEPSAGGTLIGFGRTEAAGKT